MHASGIGEGLWTVDKAKAWSVDAAKRNGMQNTRGEHFVRRWTYATPGRKSPGKGTTLKEFV